MINKFFSLLIYNNLFIALLKMEKSINKLLILYISNTNSINK